MLIAGPRGTRRRPPVRVLLAPVAAALLLHGALLAGTDPEVGMTQGQATAVVWMQARSIEPVAAAIEPAILAAPPVARPARETPAKPMAVPPAKPARLPLPSPPMALAPPMPEESLPVADDPTSAPAHDVEFVRTVAALPAHLAAAAPAAVPAAASVADSPPPTYRTVLPPPATLRYDMRRGMLSGSGELIWKPAGAQYEARLEGRVAGVHVLTETSTGVVDAHGIAPLRYTDWRIRRPVSAANFQRDKGKITYSGPQVEFPLLPGTQDRVSWMLQIAGVLNAEPTLAKPGGRIAFFVTGARGDADVWVFRYVAAETVTADGGTLSAVKFTREPRKAYDRMVEVWLAPARHHLPVRARLTERADGDVFELLLRGIQSP